MTTTTEERRFDFDRRTALLNPSVAVVYHRLTVRRRGVQGRLMETYLTTVFLVWRLCSLFFLTAAILCGDNR